MNLPATYGFHPFETKCSSCEKLIVWFNTTSGRKMPVDAETTKPTDAAHQLDLSRHKSHFATCPNANKHRRRR